MRLDDQQPVDQAIDVINAKPGARRRQAGPINAAHAVGHQIPRLDGELIGFSRFRLRLALILDAGGGVEQGAQFPLAASVALSCVTICSIIAAEHLPHHAA